MLAVEPRSAAFAPLDADEEAEDEREAPELTRELLLTAVARPRLVPPSPPTAVALGPETALDLLALLWTASD